MPDQTFSIYTPLPTPITTWQELTDAMQYLQPQAGLVDGTTIQIRDGKLTLAYTGTLPDTIIPTLSWTKLSGDLPISKVADGTLTSAKILSLEGSKLTGSVPATTFATGNKYDSGWVRANTVPSPSVDWNTSGSMEFTHALGGVPDLVLVWFRYHGTAPTGLAVDEQVAVGAYFAPNSAGTAYSLGVRAHSTKVTLKAGASLSAYEVGNGVSSTAASLVDNGTTQLQVRCVAVRFS